MSRIISFRLPDAEGEKLDQLIAQRNARPRSGRELAATASSVLRELIQQASLDGGSVPVDLSLVRERKALNEAGKSDLPRSEVIEETVKLVTAAVAPSETPPLRLVEAPASVPVDDKGPPALPLGWARPRARMRAGMSRRKPTLT